MLSFPTSVLWFSNTNWVSSESTQFWCYLEYAQTLQVKGSFAQTAFTSDASSKSQEFWPNAYKPGESHNLLLRFQYSLERFTEFMKRLYLHFAAYYKGYISGTGSGKWYLGHRMGARALVWIFHALPRHATLSALQWLPLPRERSGGRWSWKFQHSDHGLILFVVVIQSLSHVQLLATPCNPIDYSTPGYPVLHHLPELAQTHIHCIYHLVLCCPLPSCLQSFPASGSFPMSRLFVSGDQSIGASASTSVLLINIQDWYPLGLTGWISLQSKGILAVFNITAQKHQFFSIQPSLWSNSHIHAWLVEKP